MKKQVGFFGLLALSVGLNIGGSLFGLTTVAAGLTGPSLPLALLISALPVILAVLPFSVLVSAAPTTAATYRYAQLLSPSLALITMLAALTCAMIGGLPLLSRIFGLYLQNLLPINPTPSALLILTVLLACATSINAVFALVPRWLLVLGTEGLLPRFLSRVDIEKGSPVGGLTLAYVLAALALLSQPPLLFLGALINFPVIVAVTFISVLVIILPHRFPIFYQHSAFHPPPLVLWAVCGAVITANVAFFVFLASASPKATWTYAGMLIVFSLYAISRRKTLATLHKITPLNDSSTRQIPVI